MKNNEFEIDFIQGVGSSNLFTSEVKGTQYTYYLTGELYEPAKYVDLCNILRTANEQDEVIIRINSRGGRVDTERMIVNAIHESKALVTAFIEYECMSAATGIFLAAHEHAWSEHIQFMVHCAYWGILGKNPDVKSQTEFGIKQLEEEIESTYSGLLTPEEIKMCNEGKEFWFGSKELQDRMQKFYEYRNSVQNDFEGSAEPTVNISTVIEQKVEEAVEKALSKVMKKLEDSKG